MIIRRLLLPAVTTTIVAGPLGLTPAQAAYADSAALTQMTVASTTVAAPAITDSRIDCTAGSMSVTWSPSTSPGVIGYRVTAQFNKAPDQTTQLGPDATSWSAPLDPRTAQGNSAKVVLIVTTLTSYGWTAGAQTRPLSC